MNTTTATATATATALALQERMRGNMFSHIKCENEAAQAGETRQALAEERVKIITDYAGDHAGLIGDLRIELAAFPVGSDQLKARKQSWKRSFQKAFSKVWPELELVIIKDTPRVVPATPVLEKSWEQKLTEALEDAGASDQLIKATIKTVSKQRAAEAARIEQAKEKNLARLRQENAAKVAELRAKLAELEKVA